MRVIYLLLIVCLSLVSAKYLPNDSASLAHTRRHLRSVDDDDTSSSSDSSEDRTVENNLNNVEEEHKRLKQQEEHKRVQEERKRDEILEREKRKRQEEERKHQERQEKEERKWQEKLEKEERKRQEKNEKEKHKREEAERKEQEKLEKQERKREEKLRKHLKKIEEETLEKDLVPDSLESAEVDDANESFDIEDIWKSYIYEKYGLLAGSTRLEKLTALNRYFEEELGLNVNSTKSDRRQAVIKLIQDNINSNGSSENNLKNYMRSHINAVAIQKLSEKLEKKIVNLNNDSRVLENITWPWVPAAKANIDEKRFLMQSVLQFLTHLLPSSAIGEQKPLANSSASGVPAETSPHISSGSSLSGASSLVGGSSLDSSNTNIAVSVDTSSSSLHINSPSSSSDVSSGTSDTLKPIAVEGSGQDSNTVSMISSTGSNVSVGITGSAPGVEGSSTSIGEEISTGTGVVGSVPTDPQNSSGSNEPDLPGVGPQSTNSSTGDVSGIIAPIDNTIATESGVQNSNTNADGAESTSMIHEAGHQGIGSSSRPSLEPSTTGGSLATTESGNTVSSGVENIGSSSVLPEVEQKNTGSSTDASDIVRPVESSTITDSNNINAPGAQNTGSNAPASEGLGETGSVDISISASIIPVDEGHITGADNPALSESTISGNNQIVNGSDNAVSSDVQPIGISPNPTQIGTVPEENAEASGSLNSSSPGSALTTEVQEQTSTASVIAPSISSSDSNTIIESSDASSQGTNTDSALAVSTSDVTAVTESVSSSGLHNLSTGSNAPNAASDSVDTASANDVSSIQESNNGASDVTSAVTTLPVDTSVISGDVTESIVAEFSQVTSVDVAGALETTATEKSSVVANDTEATGNLNPTGNTIVTDTSSTVVPEVPSSESSSVQQAENTTEGANVVEQEPIIVTDASVLTPKNSTPKSVTVKSNVPTEIISEKPLNTGTEGKIVSVSSNNAGVPTTGLKDNIAEVTTEILLIGEPWPANVPIVTEADIEISTMTTDVTDVVATTPAAEELAPETIVTDTADFESTTSLPGIVTDALPSNDITTVKEMTGSSNNITKKTEQASAVTIENNLAAQPETPVDRPIAEEPVQPGPAKITEKKIKTETPVPETNVPDVNTPVNAFNISPEPGAMVVDVQLQQESLRKY